MIELGQKVFHAQFHNHFKDNIILRSISHLKERRTHLIKTLFENLVCVELDLAYPFFVYSNSCAVSMSMLNE